MAKSPLTEEQKQKLLEAMQGDFSNQVGARATREAKLAQIETTRASLETLFEDHSREDAESLMAEAESLAAQWRAYVEQTMPIPHPQPTSPPPMPTHPPSASTLTLGKLKAVYLLWLFLNLMLLVLSPSPFGERSNYYRRSRYGDFYPWHSAPPYYNGLGFDHTDQYDITEFAFYSLAPLVLWYAVRLWRSDANKE